MAFRQYMTDGDPSPSHFPQPQTANVNRMGWDKPQTDPLIVVDLRGHGWVKMWRLLKVIEWIKLSNIQGRREGGGESNFPPTPKLLEAPNLSNSLKLSKAPQNCGEYKH